ncbi:PEP-CTERM sorting domain-containing protein [Massilia sp. METH4]|uniref:PEP-CTERM sorting domain-containing protein n=1 Tax=Massilia sp. METH4 TaxID=3123041 RepID=UPI0030D0BCEE
MNTASIRGITFTRQEKIMILKLISGALLAAVGTLTHAATVAPTQWEFTWKGFSVYEEWIGGHYEPDLTITGRFAGIDANGDGVLEKTEVTSLTIDRSFYDYAACPAQSPEFRCGLWSFTYSAAGGLEFTAGHTSYDGVPGQDDWWTAHSVSYDTSSGIYEKSYGYQWPGEEYSLSFTDSTVKTVKQISPVPEPATYAMLASGLLLLGAARRRRK